jgi:glutamate racemase
LLGVFDSGLGGLTVVRRLRELLPQHDLLFFADQANVPYGDRTPGELHEFTVANLALLNAAGARAIVMACNTSCATAAELGWPHSEVPILDLIESAAVAVREARFARIGVVATAATAKSGAYAQTIAAFAPGTHVVEVAAPALVPLVEAGEVHGPRAAAAVHEACARLPHDVDAVILGCTHYPLLQAHFAAALGAAVALIDPAIVHARRAAELAVRTGVGPGTGRLDCWTSGDLHIFRERVEELIGDLHPRVSSAVSGSESGEIRRELASESTGG